MSTRPHLHIFNLFTETCENCGISRLEMEATQAMDICPGNKVEQLGTEEICKTIREKWKFPPNWEESDAETRNNKPVYIEARLEARTMEVNVSVHGVWISLDDYCKQYRPKDIYRGLAKGMVEVDNEICVMSWKSGVEIGDEKFAGEMGGDTDVMIDGEPVVLDAGKLIRPKNFYGKVTIPRDKFSDEQFAAIKQNLLQDPGSPGKKVEETKKNYCSPHRMFSRCEAGKTWKDHQKCRFSEKASRAERCMYFRDFNDVEHCDCVDAQRELYLSEDNS